MSRETYTRSELVQALRVITRFLQGFPDSMTFGTDDTDDTAGIGVQSIPPDGQPISGSMPGDAKVLGVSLRGQPQPARKKYVPAPKVKRDRIVWDELPRAARRIGQLVLESSQPLTSHEIMAKLKIARPTFNNAMSVLSRGNIVAAITARGSSRGAEHTR